MFLTDPVLTLHPAIRHGFFGRAGGISRGIYESLNAGFGSADDRGDVAENRARIVRALSAGVDDAGLLTVHQIHSPHCVPVFDPWASDDPPQADALATDRPGIAISVLTADCAPVLFAGLKADGAPVVGAAHAGWGGALRGVVESTVESMRALGAVRIAAVIGPCIGPASYEVTEDFMPPFTGRDAAAAGFFSAAGRPGHRMFDLPAYVAFRLEQAGVPNAPWTGQDTYPEDSGYFSFRRATHRGEGDYGRQASAIAIAAV